MWFIKFLVYGMASIACSKVFFHSSTFAITVVFCTLNAVADMSKKDFKVKKRMSRQMYIISFAACFIGLALIITGKFFQHNDMYIIDGALMFAASIMGMIIDQWFRLPGYLKKWKQDAGRK